MSKTVSHGALKQQTIIKHSDGSRTRYVRTNLPKIAKVMTDDALWQTKSSSWRDRAADGYRNVALSYGIPQSIVDNQWHYLDASLVRIDRRWQEAVKDGTATVAMANRNIDRLSLQSFIESSRQVYVTDQRRLATEHRQKIGQPREARLLSTTADEPDLTHALIEGTIMSEDRVLAHCQRFGCKHSYEVIEDIL